MSRSYHHGALAEALLSEALDRVRADGVDKLSLRAVAEAVGVSPSAAYNHFADKDALLRSVGTCALAALDERMAKALAAHPAQTRAAAVLRFRGLGRAYISFAVEEPHLFPLAMDPMFCAAPNPDFGSSGPFLKLKSALDDLESFSALKPGVRPGLELSVWSATHGMAGLVVGRGLPTDAIEGFLDSQGRLILTDDSLAEFSSN